MQTHCQVTTVAREQLCGHVSPATREHTIIEVQYMPGLYNMDHLPLRESLEMAFRRVGG
jgi:hypothetical protein